MRNLKLLTTIAGLISLAILCPILHGRGEDKSPTKPDQEQGYQQALALQNKITSVIEKVLPCYVFIGGGSGVIISSDGYVLTNYHVVGMSRRWILYHPDGSAHKAEIIGYDPQGDLALLKIQEANNLPFLNLGDSDKLRIGETVLAIGNPFGLGIHDLNPSVTLGIISALHRYQAGDYVGRGEYADAVQTDTAINPGNSGGPLINLQGELVGINGRIESELPFVRANTGIGYAIPANQIKKFLPYLKKGGKVWHGHIDGLGLSPKRVENGGVKIARVRRGSQARELGFRPNDVIIEVAGEAINHHNRLLGIIASLPAGASITLRIKRADEIIKVTTVLEEKE